MHPRVREGGVAVFNRSGQLRSTYYIVILALLQPTLAGYIMISVKINTVAFPYKGPFKYHSWGWRFLFD